MGYFLWEDIVKDLKEWIGRFEGNESDFPVIIGESICVHAAIMHDCPRKEPRSSKEDVTSIHGHHIPPDIIFVVLPNR